MSAAGPILKTDHLHCVHQHVCASLITSTVKHTTHTHARARVDNEHSVGPSKWHRRLQKPNKLKLLGLPGTGHGAPVTGQLVRLGRRPADLPAAYMSRPWASGMALLAKCDIVSRYATFAPLTGKAQ